METLKINRDAKSLKLSGLEYVGFGISHIPNKCFGVNHPNNPETDGVKSWFNYKGLTYIVK
jgi:hypothetical protein